MAHFHKLLLPFNKFHFPDYEQLTEAKRETVKKLNSEILSKKYKIVEHKCLCGCEHFDIVATIDKNSVFLPTAMCRNCGLIQTNPRFSEIFYRELYKKDMFNKLYYASDDIEHFVLQRLTYSTGEHILHAIEKEMTVDSNISVVEIGAGAGWNLIPFLHKKAKVSGIDYNPQLVEFAQKYNLPVHMGDENSLVGQYDIIILNHVLEHMPNPLLSLLKITEHLKNNGLLYIGVPYVLNFDLTTLSLPHIYYFTPFSLKYFVSEANLVPVKINFINKNSFYGIFRKGFYHNQELLKINVDKTKRIISRRFRKETLLLHKKVKSLEDVPAKVLFNTAD